MGLPELIIAGTLGGGLMKADAQSRAGGYNAQSLRVQGQAAQAKLENDAAATEASATPILAAAKAADYNAQIAKDQAALTLQIGAEEEARSRVSSSNDLATGRAAASASGIEVSGSALDVLASNAQNAELNALTIRHKSLVQANAYLNAQTMDEFQATQARTQAAYVLQQGAYIRSTVPSTAQQYANAATAAADAGSNASVATLIDTGTKLASSDAARSAFSGSSAYDGSGSLMGRDEAASLNLLDS